MLFYYPWGAYTERHNAFVMKLQKIVIKLTLLREWNKISSNHIWFLP